MGPPPFVMSVKARKGCFANLMKGNEKMANTAQLLLIAGGVLTLAVSATYMIPSAVHVERTAIIDADPAEVLAMAASTEGFQQINPYASVDPDLKITPFGPASGVGAGFHFDGKDGKGSQTVVAVTGDQVRYAIDLGPMGQPTQAITVAPAPGGTKVTWSMDTEMGMNPIARVFGLFMDRMMGKTFDRGLKNMAEAA